MRNLPPAILLIWTITQSILSLCATTVAAQSRPSAQPAVLADELPTLLDAYAASCKADDAESMSARRQVIERLGKLEITPEQHELIFERAAAFTRPGKDLWSDPAAELLQLLEDHVTRRDIELTEKYFDRLHLLARCAALENLTALKSREAAGAFTRLALRGAAENKLEPLRLGSFSNRPDLLLPHLPDLLKIAELDNGASFNIYAFVLQRLERDGLPAKMRTRVREAALGSSRRVLAALQAIDAEPPDAPRDADRLDCLNGLLGLVLDILSHLPGKGVDDAARACLAVSNLETRTWAVVLALMNKVDVPEERIMSIADSVNHRARLLRVLSRRELLTHYPEKHRNNEATALARMVSWLEHPTELGEPPEKIELARRVEMIDEDGKAVEYFVLKFLPRKHKPDDQPKWEMGVCGPYNAGTFDPDGGGDTFSNFTPWTPGAEEKEVEKIRKQIAEAWKREAERAKDKK